VREKVINELVVESSEPEEQEVGRQPGTKRTAADVLLASAHGLPRPQTEGTNAKTYTRFSTPSVHRQRNNRQRFNEGVQDRGAWKLNQEVRH